MRSSNFRFQVTTLAGSTIHNINEMLEQYHVEPGYRRKFLLSKAVAGILGPFTLAERLIWQKRTENLKLQTPPVFIIGFWRSGTTLLHNLLCQDPEAAYTTTFQTVFPNLLLTQSWWLKPLVNHFLPTARPYDNVKMDMDFPQEEDFGLMNMQPSTIYKFFLFPADYDNIIESELFTANLDEKRLAQWKKAYRAMIAKAVLSTGGKRYIGKNPCHLTRIALLKEMFPDAKFIFIHRHPGLVIESLYRFILSIFPGVQLQDVPEDFTREKVAILYNRMINSYLTSKDLIPSGDLLEIRMDEFTNDIPGHLKRIYEKFSLGDFSAVEPVIMNYLSRNPYPERITNPSGPEIPHLVQQYAAGIMETLGYKGYEINQTDSVSTEQS